MSSINITRDLSYVELGSVPPRESESKKSLIGIITKCGPNCLSYGIITDGAEVRLCVVANREPKNVAGMVVHEHEGLYYCCVNGNYTTNPTCNFSNGPNYSYLIGVDNNIVYGLAPTPAVPKNDVKVVSYSAVVAPKSVVVVNQPPKLSKNIKALLEEFIERESKYLAIPVLAKRGGNGKNSDGMRTNITLLTPYAEGRKCNRERCDSISCTGHDINTYVDTLAYVSDNWKSYKKNNFNHQLGGVAKVLYNAYVDYLNDDYVDWGEVMTKALHSMVMDGEAFTVIQ